MAYKRKRSYSAPGGSKYKRARSTRRGTARRFPMRRRYKRRTNNSARTGRTMKSQVFSGVGLPKALVMSFPYRNWHKLTSATLGLSDYAVYSLNGLYDPYVTGVGDQPLYVDQVLNGQLYDKYLVYKVDVEIVFRSQSTDNDIQVWAVADTVANDSAWSPTQVFYYGERPKWFTKQLESTSTGGPLSRAVYRRTFHMADVFGISKTKLYAEDAYSARFNSNPSRQCFLTFGSCDAVGEQIAGLPCDAEIYIRYHARLYDNLQAPPQS